MNKYTLNEVMPNIFLINFDSHYDLAMTFLRYQEFYESISSKFQNKTWSLIDYMEWYSERNNGVFTYPIDWAGFNIPSWVIEKVCEKGIPDYNKYDEIIINIFDKLHVGNDGENRKFYLIGTYGNGEGVIEHEIAHGLFYTNSKYRREMKKLVEGLPIAVRNRIFKVLKEKGYASNVHIDECQAYLSTGILDEFGAVKKFCSAFEKVFKKFTT